jgi:hypothetical protein
VTKRSSTTKTSLPTKSSLSAAPWNDGPAPQAARSLLVQAKAPVDPRDPYLRQLALWGLSSEGVMLTKRGEHNRDLLMSQLEALWSWKPATVNELLLPLPPPEDEGAYAGYLESLGPRAAASALLENLTDLLSRAMNLPE